MNTYHDVNGELVEAEEPLVVLSAKRDALTPDHAPARGSKATLAAVTPEENARLGRLDQ